MHRIRRSSTGRRALVVAACLFLVVQVAPGGAQTTQSKLDEAKRRVAQLQKELARADARLDQVQADIDGITARMTEGLRQREVLQDQMALTREHITQREKREGRLQTRLDDRARDVYIDGPIGALEFVLTADSLADLSDRVSFLDALSRSDISTAAGVELVRKELQKQRAFLAELTADVEEILDQLRRESERLQAKWEEQAAIRAGIEEKREEAEALVADLKKKLKRELLAQLRAAGSTAPIDASGLLKWCPVDPPRSYIDDFGFPRVGHTHQGNDVFAPEGTPIRAPFAGRADESSNGLGGLTVNVYAPDGTYVYNAHMSKYAGVDGKQVQPGDLIGYVGNTGNAAGTPPHDHFELHPGGGSAITPYPYLNAVCGVNGGG